MVERTKNCGCHKKNILKRCYTSSIWRIPNQLVHPYHHTSNLVLICALTMTRRRRKWEITYASVIGSLLYVMVCTHPHKNIAHSVGVVSRFLANLNKQHWQAVKWISRYLKGTSNYCLCFGNNNVVLEGYIDVNMARDVDTIKSTTGYLCTFASVAVSWMSRLQKVVTVSTIEVEYITATKACKEMLWMQWFVGELGIKQDNICWIVIVRVLFI